MLTAILVVVVIFFGLGTIYEAYEDKGLPTGMGPKFLLVSGFLFVWLFF